MAAAGSDNFNYGYPTPGPQEPTGTKVMDHIFFLSEEKWKAAREKERYDLVIVGTGFCGLAVAHRALENQPNLRILMLERGGFFLPEHFQNLPLPMKETLGGLSETFPWTLAASTMKGEDGPVTWQHGMVNFFGGRSTLWSAWCPTPTRAEMHGWPRETVDALNDERELFEAAKSLLDVRPADLVDSDACAGYIYRDNRPFRPVYRNLQKIMQRRLEQAAGKARPGGGHAALRGFYRAEAAPLASGSRSGVDFEKFSTPGKILDLLQAHKDNLHIATNCTVRRILRHGKAEAGGEAVATALDTSRGILALHDAKLVLAMGTLPPVTLIRNSFPELSGVVGQRFSSHFITSIAARVTADDFLEGEGEGEGQRLHPNPESHAHSHVHVKKSGQGPEAADRKLLQQLEVGACYVAGTAGTKDQPDYRKQFHVQLTALYDENPRTNARKALRYMPDVVATASMEQLLSSEGHVVFICAVLGEMDYDQRDNKFTKNEDDPDITTNSILRIRSDGPSDGETWKAMDDFTFAMLETVLARQGHGGKGVGNGGAGAAGNKEKPKVEYWHADGPSVPTGKWRHDRPKWEKIRVPALVHESSTLHIGAGADAPVGLDYRLKGVKNVYITGAGLWPQGGSWNPTLCMVALAMDLTDKLFGRIPVEAAPAAATFTAEDVVNAFDSADNLYMCIKDRESKFLWANTSFAQLVGKRTAKELIGTHDENRNHTTDDQEVLSHGRSFPNHRETIQVPGDKHVKICTQKGALRKAGGIAGVTVCFHREYDGEAN